MPVSTRAKRWLWVGGIAFVVLGIPAIIFGPTIVDLWPTISEAIKEPEMHEYTGTTTKNLKAMHTAFTQFHDSEERYPDATKWMDEVKNYIKTGDLTEEEAAKKLMNPRFGTKAGQYGFAMNSELSKKYKGDIKDPKTILVYETSDLKRNASGKPGKLSQTDAGIGITISGDIVPLP